MRYDRTIVLEPTDPHATSQEDDGPGWFETPAQTVTTEARGTTYLEAINRALVDELAGDERVVLIGEDIGVMGGAFRVTNGLWDRFGGSRVIDTPMAEAAIVGMAIGMAIEGLRPIVELQFSDFISCGYDQLVTEAAKLHYRFGIAVPIVVRAPSGAGVGAGPFHSQSPEGIFAHVPGLKVVCPGTVQDAYDLLRLAVKDPNPVLYFEHKALYRSLRGSLEPGLPVLDLGVAAIRRVGRHLTLVTYGGLLRSCLQVADDLAQEGIELEVIDLRSLQPLDMATVGQSVAKTARAVIVHEDTLSFGVGAEVAARLSDEYFFSLDAPIMRVAPPDTPVPFARPLEDAYVPQPGRIMEAVRKCLAV